jgi:hypothetical protein
VILVVTEDGSTQVFKKKKHEYLPELKVAIEKFYEWIEKNEKN